MQIAIVHYHLNRGGVTQVIANHLRSLSRAIDEGDRWRVLLIYGGRREGWPEDLPRACPQLEIARAEIPGLDYDDGDGGEGGRPDPSATAAQLASELLAALRHHGFTPGETILHVHNHALGKNVALPRLIELLAPELGGTLLQIHDFAEDFRPELYLRLQTALTPDHPERLPAVLYPQGSGVHYGVLNGRDRSILSKAGVAATRLHWLPNPVAPFDGLPPRNVARRKLADHCQIAADTPLLLYPVRGIRRKNLGELLLWSALADGAATLAVTLSPLNPTERGDYEAWRQLAAELDLNCRFGIGDSGGLGFAENVAAADALMTTSVAEGFGMVFLEAWLAGRPLVGRNLPEITGDFTEQGLRLDDMYDRLAIPLDWIGHDTFRQSLATTYAGVLRQYGRREAMPARFDEAFAELVAGDDVDFGSLDIPLQRQVLASICQSAVRRSELIERNAWFAEALTANDENHRELVQQNRQVIENNYSLERFGGRLRDLYVQILAEPRASGPLQPPPAGEQILESFLQLKRLRPLRMNHLSA
ncbi:MAG: hypothetical protein DWQ31_05225 [Planctomycetota bacterium]|nr:MAG: hypothetical protein DWQ31_05225 [Planctomycetota bacterium]REJ97591.1 MAG: hypothetical protein DWQ35_01635 [Planctomycetota bacterium]REK23013.1 MAG: hypothetical protein DWQ42_15935 [Planctomycetota bacterium]REK43376.1 MAG: hypothetical protein DWQ46_11635 [Planctomycetota bacterium]